MLRFVVRLFGAAVAFAAFAPGVADAARGRDHLFAHARAVRVTQLAGMRAVRVARIAGTPVYELVSAYDGKCLDVYRRATGNGSRVDQWTCNGGSNQLRKVLQAGTTSGNLPIYEFVGVGSGRCLDVYGDSHANGAAVDIWDCNGQANQQWIDFPEAANDLIDRNTENDASPKALEIYGGATGNGARVDQWSNNASTTKDWYFN
jgi:Ricin-type beta-trefoil lectin domain